MKNFVVRILALVMIVLGIYTYPAIAADTNMGAAAKADIPGIVSESDSEFGILLGNWVRPDGGYTITIRGVDTDGKLDAAYANPRPLPFSQARTSLNDSAIQVFLELRAGGYNGSTYNLTYDSETDVLRGVYYQAVAQQKFDVYFERVQ